MFRSLLPVVLSSTLILSASFARAQGGVLVAANDPQQVTELDLAQVMASDATHWLSVRVKGRTRLALITAASLETTSSSDAWLRALDFATRERIAAPPGPLATCPERASFPLADSGLPELASIAAQQATQAASDVELQRALIYAGIPTNLSDLSEFSAHNPGPYEVTWFDAPPTGGGTAALRWVEHGATNVLPELRVVGRASVPISVIALAKDAVWSSADGEADPSEFAVTYFALGAASDYVSAREGWQHDNPDRWLLEAQKTPALFEQTVFAGEGEIPPAAFRYFSALTGNSSASAPCMAQVKDARARSSQDSADFTCGGGDDLAQTMSELGFADVRLTRFFGSTSAGAGFVVRAGAEQNPRLQATDFETKGCSPVSNATPGGSVAPGGGVGTGPGTGTGTGTGTSTGSGSYTSGSQTTVETSVDQTSSASDSSGCGVFVDTSSESCNGDSSTSNSSSSDSCSGDSSSSDSSSDSCSGNSSSDPAAASDSCSGNSSSDSAANDSCSGNSSSDPAAASDSCSGSSDSSSNDSSGCGSNDKSGYDGDTCTGNSASSTSQGLTGPRPAKPHRVRLSLITLLAAGLSLPLRRRLK